MLVELEHHLLDLPEENQGIHGFRHWRKWNASNQECSVSEGVGKIVYLLKIIPHFAHQFSRMFLGIFTYCTALVYTTCIQKYYFTLLHPVWAFIVTNDYVIAWDPIYLFLIGCGNQCAVLYFNLPITDGVSCTFVLSYILPKQNHDHFKNIFLIYRLMWQVYITHGGV